MITNPAILGPWPKGVNNRDADYDLADECLRDAINVTVTRDGRVKRAPGYVSRLSAQAHSVYSDGERLFGVVAGTLCTLIRGPTGALTAGVTLYTGLPRGRLLSYATLNRQTYWTNNIVTGKITNGVNGPWGCVGPGDQPKLAAVNYGGMDPGLYQVAMTFSLASGEESGTPEAAQIAVAQGGGIALTGIPQPPSGSYYLNLYLTTANGSILRHLTALAAGVTSLTLGKPSALGRRLETQFMGLPIAGQAITFFRSRIAIAVGKRLYFTRPLRFGGLSPDEYTEFPADITILVAGISGIYVASDRIYWLGGQNPPFQISEALPYGAVPGTVIQDPTGTKAAFLSHRGLCIADLNGGITNVSEANIAMDRYRSGAMLWHDLDGDRRIITSLTGVEVANPLVNQDFTAAQVLRG